MAFGSNFIKDCVILDACVVINLYASGYMQAILAAIPCKIMMTSYVKDEETLSTIGRADGDLQQFIDNGLIVIVEPEFEQEEEKFINFVYARLDEGEAYTGAIGIHRDWSIATDDKLAIRTFTKLTPPAHILTTLDLVKHWVENTNPSNNEISVALKNIKAVASYVPGKNHHLYSWWENFISQ